MKFSSPAFEEGAPIPRKHTCQGENVSPPLRIEDPPEGTKSFVLIIDDPDAQAVAGFTWRHWLVKDIPAATREIAEDAVPGNQIVNHFNKPGYGGPCPPDRRHTYVFRLYALDTAMLEAGGADSLYAQAEKHALEKAQLTGTYEKT